MIPTPEPFRVDIPQDAIDDLHRRLDATRWPGDVRHPAGSEWAYGMPETYLRELVAYWRNGFDWRAAEARINGFDQFTMPIDGLVTHFIHQRSTHAEATPLLLVHGWPGSIVEFMAAIPRLTQPERFGGRAEDAFHIVCPSLPGYGFSEGPSTTGLTPKRIAERHAALMAALGYERYVVQGGDWGAIISRFMPDVCPENMIGLHLNMMRPRPPVDVADPFALITPEERARLAEVETSHRMMHGYSHLQGTKPQTAAYGVMDSPTGLLGWIGEKFHGWTDNGGDIRDAVSWDDLLTNVSIYWFTGTIASSFRLYREFYDSIERGEKTAAPCRVPTGGAHYPAEIIVQPRGWAEIEYNLVHWFEAPKGGHFAALEQPEIFAEDLWAFHRVLKGLTPG